MHKEIRLSYSKEYKSYVWMVCDDFGDTIDEGLNSDMRDAFEAALYVYEGEEV